MVRKHHNIAIIPARAGSKGLPGKNIALLMGKPLIQYTIEAAVGSRLFDIVLVTTDIQDLIQISNTLEVTVHKRIPQLCKDDVPLFPVIKDALVWAESNYFCRFDNIFTLQPTSPLRTAKHIVEAYALFKKARVSSLLSVQEERHSIWRSNRGVLTKVHKPIRNRQHTNPYYISNGAIFITKRNLILHGKSRTGGKVVVYTMDTPSSIDIHTLEDLELAHYYLTRSKSDE